MPKREGITLLELVLVLAILVVMAALVYPSLDGLYSEMRVQQSADQVRARLAEARGRAMNEGRPYQVAVMLGYGNLRVAPDNPAYWSGAPPDLPADAIDLPLVLEEALPTGVRFHHGDGPPPIDADPGGDSALPSGSVDPGGWQVLATFLPDGTARDDAVFWVYGPRANPILLQLRGLTGTVSAESVLRHTLTEVGR